MRMEKGEELTIPSHIIPLHDSHAEQKGGRKN